MEQKSMTRDKLSQKIEAVREKLQTNVLFVTGIRATKDGTLSLEVCQNRVLEGRAITALSLLNQSDERFGKSGTLLFDWVKTTPADIVKVFPELKLTTVALEAIAKTWAEDQPTGSDALVYPIMQTITKMVGDGVDYTPMITVTEATETEIKNGEFFTDSSERQEENIDGALTDEYRVMKTGSEDDADYIVHPITGDRIFRYTRFEALETSKGDVLVSGKITRKQYVARQARAAKAKGFRPEDILIDENEKVGLKS